MNNILEILNNGNIILGVLFSFIGGFVASFSPCSLSSLPLIIGYVSKTKDNKNNLKYCILFSIGTTITFVLLGVISVLIGRRVGIYGNIINVILSIILILVSLNLFGVIESKKVCRVPKLKKNLFSAFFLGILGGIINSPCSAPILISILTYASVQSNLFIGIILMLIYSIGHSVIIIVAGTSFSIIDKIASNEKYIKLANTLKIIFGAFTLLLALYFLYTVF